MKEEEGDLSTPERESNVHSSIIGRELATADVAVALQSDTQDDLSDADDWSMRTQRKAESVQTAALEEMINKGNWFGAIKSTRDLNDNKISSTNRGLVDKEVESSGGSTSSNSTTSEREGATSN
eukprot:2849624-Ditylum_brightwellii.AAC.2